MIIFIPDSFPIDLGCEVESKQFDHALDLGPPIGGSPAVGHVAPESPAEEETSLFLNIYKFFF